MNATAKGAISHARVERKWESALLSDPVAGVGVARLTETTEAARVLTTVTGAGLDTGAYDVTTGIEADV